MQPLRVLVVDDEPHARRGLSKLVSAVPGFEVAAEAGNGPDAIHAIEGGGIDLMLLDVQMPGMSGFDVMAALGSSHMPAVVFVTAYDRYAVRAFEVAAIDYILKPFSESRLEQALTRARASRASPPPVRFVVISRGTRTLVSASEVEWISGAGYYSRLHIGSTAKLIRESLQSVEKRVPSADFIRVHRSAIVRRDAIRSLHRTRTGATFIGLASGARVRLSRTYRASIRQMLDREAGV